eukprot:TRINITY_DN2752_c0_g1::TRINITY_DN2752_c0_g1_i2::g.27618::m.27618 TRINITY_DN2752_c0_g1::TRINITY_DN2752_c0_g1_i2::g.27618  ORF type:complete len:244 (+),score=7.05,sp/Q4G0X4/KCD21_HUMAN/31.91/8e-12,BTB_2/PF02214.17/7.5e-12,BTB_2/PF02214.17/4.7e+03 TRINITY_DN2752_c0_g1_i2:195-926(+)
MDIPQVIKLNVGGTVHMTRFSTLLQYGENYLTQMVQNHYKGLIQTPEIDGALFIDRDGTLFKYVLEALRAEGPDSTPTFPESESDSIRREFDFYGVPLPSTLDDPSKQGKAILTITLGQWTETWEEDPCCSGGVRTCSQPVSLDCSYPAEVREFCPDSQILPQALIKMFTPTNGNFSEHLPVDFLNQVCGILLNDGWTLLASQQTTYVKSFRVTSSDRTMLNDHYANIVKKSEYEYYGYSDSD